MRVLDLRLDVVSTARKGRAAGVDRKRSAWPLAAMVMRMDRVCRSWLRARGGPKPWQQTGERSDLSVRSSTPPRTSFRSR